MGYIVADFVLNGRFLTRSPTGVDRVASELASALLALEPTIGEGLFRGLRPDGPVEVVDERPDNILARMSPLPSRWRGQLWEQISLARACPDDWLLSLCNMGPILRHRQIVMLHDAQVFRQPESYSFAFRRWYGLAQPRLARSAELVLTVSEHSKRELEHFGVVPPGKAKVIHNGADHILRVTPDRDTLTRHKLTPQGYFLAIGSLAPHKNLSMLVTAARARADQSLPLVIAGGGNETVFGSAGISPSQDVRLLGRVSDAELRALYQNATALVFPSLTEGFGLPPAEAMFCGCPVIASTGGAIPEVCDGAALMLDPTDTAAWTQVMDRLAEDPEKRAELSDLGRAKAANFTWARAAEVLQAHLHALPGEPGQAIPAKPLGAV